MKALWQGECAVGTSLSRCVTHHNVLSGTVANTYVLLSNFKLYN